MASTEKQAADAAWKAVLALNGASAEVLFALREAVRAEIQYQTGMSKREVGSGT